MSCTFFCCSTFGKDCYAEVSLRASEDGLALVVRSVNKDHNHIISRVMVSFLNSCFMVLYGQYVHDLIGIV